VNEPTTDLTGAVTFWNNPNYEHSVVFSKFGYEN
jgi:hypothetical protein